MSGGTVSGAGLSVEGLGVVLGGRRVVADVDLRLDPGGVLAVLGPSGCGKSTLLRAIAGLEEPAAGRVAWDGVDLAGTPTHRRGFALMFQDGQLFDHLTVARNVAYPPRLRRGPTGPRSRSDDRAAIDADVARLLDLVGLAGLGDRLPRTLSGGERQRVALARSLAARPRLLLLDEPLSALDAGLRTRLAGDLRDILAAAGTTALLVTHDQDEAFAVADRLAVMREGRVVQEGATGDVWAAPVDADTALFLGYAAVLDVAASARLLAATGRSAPPEARVALRAGALRVREHAAEMADDGLQGTVREARPTPDALRLMVDVPGLGAVPALAAPGAAGVGDVVALQVEPSGLAVLP